MRAKTIQNRDQRRGDKKLSTQWSVDQVVNCLCDILRWGNCTRALRYVREIAWILFATPMANGVTGNDASTPLLTLPTALRTSASGSR